MEEFLLSVQIGYLGIDGDDGIGELELVGEGIDEAVVADGDIAACACLEPTVAVSAKQNGATRGVVEQVVLHQHTARRAEESATGTVVAAAPTTGMCLITAPSPTTRTPPL